MSTSSSPRPASGALTVTTGYLAGFTHTLQPYLGCRFGCEYCYVQSMTVHRFHNAGLAWGDYAYPRTGIAEKLTAELARHQKAQRLDTLAIFMSSVTDPYQGLERQWQLTRACLHAFVERPPGLLMIQTRSPLVTRDLDLITQLGGHGWISFTLETDLDAVRRAITPRCPGLDQRLAALKMVRAAGANVQIAVSPCLPYSDVERFGTLLLDHADRVVVDTYASGDGGSGKRTARTEIPERYADLGWGDWRAEDAAHALYDRLHERMGERVGWSQAGFTALARSVTGICHEN